MQYAEIFVRATRRVKKNIQKKKQAHGLKEYNSTGVFEKRVEKNSYTCQTIVIKKTT